LSIDGVRPKSPKAVTTLEKDADVLLTFFDFPAEHWKHLRTGNVIESPPATVRLRQRVTKGAGSRTKGLLLAYKLLGPSSSARAFLPEEEADSVCEVRRNSTWLGASGPGRAAHVQRAPEPIGEP
jgi:hypothetical protein